MCLVYLLFMPKKIVNYAKSFIGCNEADGSADKFLGGGSSAATPWCAAFVSSVLTDCGVDMSGAYKGSVSGLMAWGKSRGAFIDGASASASNVKPGDVVIWKGGYFASHTGIVSAVYPDGSYDTIEGNSSNSVREKTGNGTTGKYKMSRTTGFVSV